MKFHLLGEETSIAICILDLAFPNSKYAIDRNMLNSHVNINIPGYEVDFPTMISVVDVGDFSTSIKWMYENMKGRTILSNLEDTIHIKGEINKLGHIDWYSETCYPAGIGAMLTFEFTSDQSYLEKLIKELDEIIAAYDVKEE